MFDACFPLKDATLHEVYGTAQTAFAAIVAGIRQGDVLWLDSVADSTMLHPYGLCEFLSPKHLLYARVKKPFDLLALAEEGLRSKCFRTVVFSPTLPLSLKAAKRLHLAAKMGEAVALSSIREEHGSPVAHTRWHTAPILARQGSTLFSWEINKNKTGTIGRWTVEIEQNAETITVAAKAFM